MDQEQRTIGSEESVTFVTLRGRQLTGKVDSGATTSCLHAKEVSVQGSQVSFVCPELSDNAIVLDCEGQQNISSADGGETARPVIRLDVEVAGQLIRGVQFNLNDRSHMDSAVLIGQNLIKAGGFVIDITDDQEPSDDMMSTAPTTEAADDNAVRAAIKLLFESNLTFDQIIRLIQAEQP